MKKLEGFKFKAAICIACAGLLIQARCAYAQITLTHNNSVALVDPTSQLGMYYWAVQNSPTTMQNQLNQQWFWYRVGLAGGEASIDTISAPIISGLTANTVTTTYLDSLGRFNLSITYSLIGGAFSSGTADITEQIAINNTSGDVLNFHFYQYSDFDLGGNTGGDFDLLSRNLFTGRINQVDQLDGANIVEVVQTPNAHHGETDTVPNTLNKLNDLTPTILDDTKTNAFGNVAWAVQWDVNIANGSSYLISKDKHLDVVFTNVPEPASFALLTLGVAGRR
jgi:hypothetical protein